VPLLDEKTKDRLARAVIRVGGVVVILLVVAIVVNIGLQAVPLFLPASIGPVETLAEGQDGLVAGSDPRREIVWVLRPDGSIAFPTTGGLSPLVLFDDPVRVVAADHEIHGLLAVLTDAGSLVVGKVRFRDAWQDGERTTSARWRSSAEPYELSLTGPWSGVTANMDGDGNVLACAWTAAGEVEAAIWSADDEKWVALTPPTSDVMAAAVSEDQAHLAVVSRSGGLRVLRSPDMAEIPVEGVNVAVRSARFLIGGGTLVVAGADGSVQVLLFIPRIAVTNRGRDRLHIDSLSLAPGDTAILPDDQVSQRLARSPTVDLAQAPPVCRVVRRLASAGAEPTVIAPSHRRRGFLVGSSDGTVALYNSTSARRLLADRWTEHEINAVVLDPKGDGGTVLSGGRLLRRAIDNPHPEISLRTLLLPVWYEGYAAPRWVWQSTGGSDAFEPKLSLWPLVFGTLKATLYAMLISVPLALAAAVYVSQLAPAWLQAAVKPAVELMAAVPSVVVGFLAALWLAPRLEAALFPTLLALASMPAGVVVALLLWKAVPLHLRRRLLDGSELVLLLAGGGAVSWAIVAVAGPLEGWLFSGDFQRYLFTQWGIRYDQRNALVVGLGLGFAVIPVIFTLAEDACSAVPRSLVSASRALGATRWQTAIRLVVPAASPGLFAAIMLGLGRAVGETMIVLMAAGNTPLLGLSPFDGMRTMSAAIAVEIPEAPVGGTLFRVLFLTGTLLFAFTLVVTTLADVVGSHLRKRYARF